ncbi:MAG: tRNA (adenosine(37)-N6)-dimethylallyltransferase MiaA [Candidatus Pacebacteria bacterium]|nr:tRNA (adenosine(37)-N6)-dimethylallyltransferase MiaA [Candidatus Paceibacterota bacterium]
MDVVKPEIPTIPILLGPTASGKSHLALEWARQQGERSSAPPQIINADAMQHYQPLRIITARPSPSDEAEFTHRLYGVLAAEQVATAAWWRNQVLAILRQDPTRPTIIVGGSGLYIQALTDGLSPIPNIPPQFRTEASERLESIGHESFHAEIARFDPTAAATIRVSDRQRMIRAWEVFAATKRPLSQWQAEPRIGKPADFDFKLQLLTPPRAIVVERINRRVLSMIEDGAVAEVANLMDNLPKLPPDLPMMKAIGVSSLLDYLNGTIDLPAAISEIQSQTRAYAKRQMTWIRRLER